jgi:hypothetical protein
MMTWIWIIEYILEGVVLVVMGYYSLLIVVDDVE